MVGWGCWFWLVCLSVYKDFKTNWGRGGYMRCQFVLERILSKNDMMMYRHGINDV